MLFRSKVSAVEEFKSSKAYDNNNTKYFLAGFSLLKRQAKEKYPDLDFEAFQPFEDDESVMPVEEVDGGTTSVDPQLDDDAASLLFIFVNVSDEYFLVGPVLRLFNFETML